MFADKTAAKPSRRHEDNLLGAHSRIAGQLRAFYTGIQEEAIPQKFLTLLEKLDEAEKSEAAAAGAKAAAKRPSRLKYPEKQGA